MYDKGLTLEEGLVFTLLKSGVVTQPSKGWYSLDGVNKSRARDLQKELSAKIEGGEIE